MGAKERKRATYITALLDCGGNIKEAAARLEIGESTLHRHLGDPEFTRAYHQARSRLLDLAISQIQNVCSDAITSLHAILKNESENASPRVAASRAVLDFAIKGIEVQDLRLRIEALEERIL